MHHFDHQPACWFIEIPLGNENDDSGMRKIVARKDYKFLVSPPENIQVQPTFNGGSTNNKEGFNEHLMILMGKISNQMDVQSILFP